MQFSYDYQVGVDGGGTKCRAVLFDRSGKALGTGLAGPANVARQPEQARQSIVAAVSAALSDAGLVSSVALKQLYVSAGLAGANLPSVAASLSQWKHPFGEFSAISDLHSASLGAHGGEDGAVLVVGTGSCAAALTRGTLRQFGGHGFMLGDIGSGAWIGHQAVIFALQALDGVAVSSAMTAAVCQHYQVTSSVELVDSLNQAPPARFGEMAPRVIELAHQGDEAALAVIKRGGDYLTAIARRALAHGQERLVLVGGVAQAILPWLDESIRNTVVTAQHGPEWGALYYSQFIAGKNPS